MKGVIMSEIILHVNDADGKVSNLQSHLADLSQNVNAVAKEIGERVSSRATEAVNAVTEAANLAIGEFTALRDKINKLAEETDIAKLRLELEGATKRNRELEAIIADRDRSLAKKDAVILFNNEAATALRQECKDARRDCELKQQELDRIKSEHHATEFALADVRKLVPETCFARISKVLGQEWALTPPLHDIFLSLLCLSGESDRKEKEMVKATLSRLDVLVFNIFYSDADVARLNKERVKLAPLINEVVKEWFSIQWPKPGDPLDPVRHKPENEMGNRIKVAKTFVLCDPAGRPLLPACVETIAEGS